MYENCLNLFRRRLSAFNVGLSSQLLSIRGKFSVNIKMNDFVGNISAKRFTPAVTSYYQVHVLNADAHRSAAPCFETLGATVAETSLLLTALNNPHPIHAADGHYIRNST